MVVLEGADATARESILAQLRSLATDLVSTDVFVLYFSGHGTLAATDDGGRLFLLPSDASPTDLEGSALDLEGVRQFFGTIPAAQRALRDWYRSTASIESGSTAPSPSSAGKARR